MAGLVPAIHVFLEPQHGETWTPATSAGTRRRSNVATDALAHSFRLLFNWSMVAYVYIMSNRRNGIVYVGVTTNLPKRSYEHREGLIDGFTKRYGLKRLVYYEVFDDVRDAIQKEKTMKHWPRAWKVRLIHAVNPDWNDLYDTLI